MKLMELYHYGVKGMKWGVRKKNHSPGNRYVVDYNIFGNEKSSIRPATIPESSNSRIIGGINYVNWAKNKKKMKDARRAAFNSIFNTFRQHQVSKGKTFIKQRANLIRAIGGSSLFKKGQR